MGGHEPDGDQSGCQIQIPIDKFVSIWWLNDLDLASSGEGAKGFKEVNWHGVRANFPALADIQKFVVDTGKSKAPKGEIGQVLYNRGVYNSVLVAEAIAEAQKITGTKLVSGQDVRRGLENLNINEARLKAIRTRGLRQPAQDDLRRSQRPFRGLHPAMGWREVGQGQRRDHAQFIQSDAVT